MFLFPIAGIVLGAAGGALVGRLLDRGIDSGFVDEIKRDLKPGQSALFLLGEASVTQLAPPQERWWLVSRQAMARNLPGQSTYALP